MRKFNKKILSEEKWVIYPEDSDIQIKIRRFPVSQGMFIPGVSNETMFEFALKKFKYCIVDWKGFTDENGKPLECNDENKELVYNYDESIMIWVSSEIARLKETELQAQKKT